VQVLDNCTGNRKCQWRNLVYSEQENEVRFR
jgi:hypothetical protein